MLHPGQFTAVLDACVLYPAPVRDLLLCMAEQNLYRPKWSDLINQEWTSNLLEKRPDLQEKQLTYTVSLMNKAFPDAEVDNYSNLIKALTLPDPDDRHVLAAAIRCHADVIVTFNLRDFPVDILNSYDIEPVHPDQFIVHLIDLDKEKSTASFKQQVDQLQNPPKSEQEVLKTLKKCNLKESAILLGNLIT